MELLFLLLTLVVLIGGFASIRRRRNPWRTRLEEEPWAQSLQAEDDQEPLDMEEARRAEDAFWEESWDGPDEDDQGFQPYR